MRDNINERREYIRKLLNDGETPDAREIARIFNSSPVAVTNDINMVICGTPAYRKHQSTGQNTRARKMGVVGILDEKDWQVVLKAHNYSCAICGSHNDLCIDHIVPVSKGGTNTPDNIQPLCRSCNSQKGNRA